jgi:signal transduction histidine kinase
MVAWPKGGQLGEIVLSLSVERLIAVARVVFASFGLLAIYLDPSQPARHSDITYAILIAYVVYAAALAGVVHLRLAVPGQDVASHLIDIATVGTLMHFTDGPTSPFFVFFTFALLAATLRWNWRGALGTSVLLVLLLVLISAGEVLLGSVPDGDFELNRLIMRSAYLIVAGAMLGYVGAFLEASRERLADLAAWPAEGGSDDQHPSLDRSLCHAARALGARRLLVTWEESDEPFVWTALFADGRVAYERLPAGTYEVLIPPSGAAAAFMCGGRQGDTAAAAVDARLVERFGLSTYATAPMAGSGFQGRVFVLEPLRLDAELLSMTVIVAARIGIELEHFTVQGQLQQAAVARERSRMAHDLHDGVLQGLTAAALQIKIIGRDVPEKLGQRLEELRGLLSDQQAAIRDFVRATRPKPDVALRFDLLSDGGKLLREIGRQWDCETSLQVAPAGASVPSACGHQLSLLLAEAVANAVRHGGAHAVAVSMNRLEGGLDIRVRDDGSGFGTGSVILHHQELREHGSGPGSIRDRVSSLGGRLDIASTPDGAALHIHLPLP